MRTYGKKLILEIALIFIYVCVLTIDRCRHAYNFTRPLFFQHALYIRHFKGLDFSLFTKFFIAYKNATTLGILCPYIGLFI